VAYRAEIEIGVRGVRSLEQLRSEINKSATAAESLNRVVGERGGLVQNIQNYVNNLIKASTTLQLVTAGTKAETKAIQEKAAALIQLSAIQERQSKLLEAEVKAQKEQARIRRLTAAGIFETTRFRQPIGPQPSPLQGQTSPVAEKIARTIAQRREEAELQNALLALEQRKAAELNKQLQIKGELNAATAREVNLLRNGIKATTQYAQPIGPARAPRGGKGVTGLATSLRSGRLSGILENAIIGGSFPLLFGQGAGAATGGAIGGLVGGAFGGAGGFAGSLLGTLIGDITQQGNQIKELGADIGFSAEQTVRLQQAFKLAGADADKFTESVQNIRGIGLVIEDQAKAIQLVSVLTEQYNGNIVKTTNALTGALESGKVTQATLNQLTSQGINIQDALAAKYKTSRDNILVMAKDGKISVQDLLDTLVDLANKGSAGAPKLQSAYEVAFNTISSKVQALASNVTTTLTASTTELNTSLESVTESATNGFTKILDALTPLTIKVAELVARFIDLGTQAASALLAIPGYVETVANGVLLMIPGLQAVVNLLSTVSVLTKGGGKSAQNTGMYGRYVPGSQQQVIKKPIGRITAPSQMAPSGGGAKGGKGSDAAAREAERVAKALRDTQAETELLRIQAGIQDRIFQAEQAKDPLLAARLKGEEDILNIQAKYANLLASESNIRVQESLVTKGLQEIENARLKTAQTLEQLETDRLDKYNTLIEDLNLELALKNTVSEIDQERLRIEFEIGRLRKEGIYSEEQLLVIQQKRLALAAKDTPGQKRMKELQQSIAELTNIENIAVSSANMMGDAFGQAFQDIINGSASAEEALAGMMKSIGENFVNMAVQIIAQQMTMIILGTILKALGIGTSGGGGGSFPSADVSLAKYAPLTPFADGGFVTGPTRAMVGEGGEPEYIIPASKMQAAMSRYASGARGESVIPDTGGTVAGGTTTATAPTGTIDIRYTVERINSVDYVTADQFQRGMAQAAQQGAAQGEQRTLRRLQQSRTTRSRLGMA
jgi:hypothetical protein